MVKKNMTIEDLAVMIKKGFDHVATKEELLVTKEELHEFRKEVHERFHTVEADIRDIKITMGPLVRVVAAMEVDIHSLTNRVNRLERKAGFAK